MKHEIGIDVRMIAHTGIGTYLRGFLGGIFQAERNAGFDLALFGDGGKALFGQAPVKQYPFHAPIYSVQEQLEYPRHLARCRLWHAPHYNVPIFKGKAKLIVTIHDIIHWIFRRDYFNPLQAFYAGVMLRTAVKKADHVITVSHRTRDDLIEHFGASPDRISVVYEGVDPKFFQRVSDSARENTLKKYGVSGKYFLYVGMLKPHKGVDWLLGFFRQMRKGAKLAANLVIIGKKSKKYPPDFETLTSLQSGGGVIYLEEVSDAELRVLYQSALALVHPSRYEGFGLTLLEAMASEIPVIACRVAAIPEIAGDGAYLVAPDADGEMQTAMTRMEADPAFREEWIKRGNQRVQRFQWKETAEKTAEIYRRVLS